MTTCKEDGHKFIYGGVKFRVLDYKLPGSGARPVEYFDWFYCERCLEKQYKRMDIEAHSYQELRFNATPMP